eukprot:2175185-Pleurochrysis_carterae.AAC.4
MRWMGAMSAMAATAAESRSRICITLAPRAASMFEATQLFRSQSAQKVAMRRMHTPAMNKGAAIPSATPALLQMRGLRCTPKSSLTASSSGIALTHDFTLRRTVPAMASAVEERSLATQAAAEDTRDAYQARNMFAIV